MANMSTENYVVGGIVCGPTVLASVWQNSPTNFVISRNTCDGIQTLAAGVDVYCRIQGNEVVGAISHSGTIQFLDISDNWVKTPASTAGLIINYDQTLAPIAVPSVGNTVRINNNHIVDRLGQAFVTLTSLTVNNLESLGNNFSIPSAITLSGMAIVGRVFYGTTSGSYYGIEYSVGDMFVNITSGARSICTVAGSVNNGADTFTTATTSGATNIVKSTNLAWDNGKGYHQCGQRITLPAIGPAGTALSTRVERCYIGGGQYLLQLETAWSTAGSGTITATNPATMVAV